MDFTELCNRLLDRLRRLADSGTVSESALARRLGISQSHLHNTLKGVRGLTIPMADQILESLHWNIWDLCSDLEVKEESARRKFPKTKCRELGVLPLSASDGVQPAQIEERISVPKVLLSNLGEPTLFGVNSQVDTAGIAEPGDVLLADIDCPSGGPFAPDGVYLFRLDGRYLLRWARKGTHCLYLLTVADWGQPHRWQRTDSAAPIGRVHAIAKRQNGMFLRPAPPSVSS